MADITEITGCVATRDAIQLFYRKYEAENEKARLVIAHGLGEHSGRYGNVVELLVPKGFSIWAGDHRGHGRSTGPRGHVLHFDQYLMDLKIIVELARADLPEGRKLFLLGHSMGGLMCLTFAMRFPKLIDGVIASSPALGMAIKVPVVKAALGKVMSSVWPGLTLDNEIDPEKISHDKQVVHEYMSDPLVHHKVSARWFTEFLSAMENAHNMAQKMSVPTLILVAGGDCLVNAPSSKEFFEKLKEQDRTLKFYDGLYHEIFNETEDERKKVLDDLLTWLEVHAT